MQFRFSYVYTDPLILTKADPCNTILLILIPDEHDPKMASFYEFLMQFVFPFQQEVCFAYCTLGCNKCHLSHSHEYIALRVNCLCADSRFTSSIPIPTILYCMHRPSNGSRAFLWPLFVESSIRFAIKLHLAHYQQPRIKYLPHYSMNLPHARHCFVTSVGGIPFRHWLKRPYIQLGIFFSPHALSSAVRCMWTVSH